MKKQIFSIMLVMSLFVMIGLVSAYPGSIWTTTSSCGSPQNVNQYYAGEKVYIHGENFNSGTYNWDISGNPFKEEDQVAFDNITIDSSGAFCFEAYTIQYSDSGVYKASVGNKNDNYQVNEIPMVPEFGLIVGGLTILSAIGIFFFARRE